MPRRFPWAVLVFVVAVLLVAPALHLRPTRANPIVILGILAVLTILHEAGHAIAALAVRHRIFEVRIGIGPAARIPIGRARLELGALPIGGHVATAAPGSRGYRPKRLVVVAAGSLMNTAVLVFTVFAHPSPGSLLYDTAVLNGILLVGNLIPYNGRSAFGPQPTDGLSLVRTLVLSERDLDEQLAAYHVAEAQRVVERGDRDAARVEVNRGLVLHPESTALRTWLGHDLVTSGRFAEARTILSQLVEEGPRRRGLTGRLIHALHLNNLAWADLMTGDAALLPEAEAASRAAIEELPRFPAIQGTRAFALIESGRVREGLELSTSALRQEKDPRNRALQACVTAIGYARDWRFQDAQRWLGTARRLDPECGLLERASQEIAGRLPRPIRN
jgi:hypothetical protein